MTSKRTLMGILALLCMAMASSGAIAAEIRTSCVQCHRALSGQMTDPVDLWGKGIHKASGVGCHDCHGGDPLDMDRAMDPVSGFTGKPSRAEVTDACGSCHSDARRMKFLRARIDQVDLYLSGQHSAALDAGKAAPNCVSCHGAHGILAVSDPLSKVHPTNVPELCAGCHGSKSLTDYRAGVHGNALVVDLNLRAPSCTHCHGVHGTIAASPVQTPMICGQCHQTEVRRFNEGPHRYSLEGIGQPGCTGCHDPHRLAPTLPEQVPERIIASCLGCHPDTGSAVMTGQMMAAELEGVLLEVRLARLRADEISMRGLDTTQIELLIQEAESWINQAIPAVHTADPEILKELTGMARDKVKSAREQSGNLQMELGFRRIGLFLISLLCIIIVALLALKLSQLDREMLRGRFGGGKS